VLCCGFTQRFWKRVRELRGDTKVAAAFVKVCIVRLALPSALTSAARHLLWQLLGDSASLTKPPNAETLAKYPALKEVFTVR
jgi:hypothetical protein